MTRTLVRSLGRRQTRDIESLAERPCPRVACLAVTGCILARPTASLIHDLWSSLRARRLDSSRNALCCRPKVGISILLVAPGSLMYEEDDTLHAPLALFMCASLATLDAVEPACFAEPFFRSLETPSICTYLYSCVDGLRAVQARRAASGVQTRLLFSL